MEPKEIKKDLASKKYNQPMIAKELGVTQTAVSLVISGKSKSYKIRSHIAEIVGKPYEELWGIEKVITKSEGDKILSISHGINIMISKMSNRRIPSDKSIIDENSDPVIHLKSALGDVEKVMDTCYFKELDL